MWVSIIPMSANGVLNYFLIPLYGIEGAAFATMCSYILMMVLAMTCASFLIKRFLFPKTALGIVVFSIVTIGVSFVLKLNLEWKIALFAVYLLSCTAWGLVMEQDEWKTGLKIIRQLLRFPKGDGKCAE